MTQPTKTIKFELVAIISEGPFFREDRKATEFRNFLFDDVHRCISTRLPDGTFTVQTRLVTIEAPQYDTLTDDDVPTMSEWPFK